MTESELIKRLFEKRAVSFTGNADSYLLRDGSRGVGQWENIGTDYEHGKLVLSDYLSYDEIEIAAFLNLSCFTPFLNNGSRNNNGELTEYKQSNGIYIGQVGARFQRHNRMEYRFMMIDSGQNTKENGYGPNNNSINWPNQVNNVNIHFGKREPAEPLNDDKLLVANWAWDANSYVGNEYWDGFLSTSGDPAAASCSFIAYFGNPELCKINEIHTW